MGSNSAMALPRQPGHMPRRRARRHGKLLTAAALLAVILLVPVLWRALLGGGASRQYGPVAFICQNPELPNGCEVTSLAMALASAGCPADKVVLYQDYLPTADLAWSDGQCYGTSPEKWYVGDAADPKGGWYCFEGPVVQAANGWLDHCGSSLRARSVTGLSKSELDRYAQDETPLVVWVTLGYAAPRHSESSWTLEDGTVYHPYSNLHCVVLAGTQESQYRIIDPINGITLIDKDIFWTSFSAMGCRAVVVE